MANNRLYSLPCLNNENYVHYDLKQNLCYGRAIRKPVLGSKTILDRMRRQLPVELSSAQLAVSCFFSLSSAYTHRRGYRRREVFSP